MFKKMFLASALLFISTLAESAQTGNTSKPAAKKPGSAATKPTATKEPALPPGADPEAIFETSMGKMKCTLFPKQAPKTVENFIGLAQGTKEWTNPATGKK